MHTTVTTLALAGAMVIGLAAPAQAVGDEEFAPVAAVSEEHIGLLATPEEMAEMGATPEQIARQSDALADLSTADSAEQATLRHEQEIIHAELSELPDLPAATPPPADPDSMSTMIYITVCWPGNDYYSVYYKSGVNNVVDCFAESGTYRTYNDFRNTTAVRPGNNIGRVYYASGAYFYWSPWRGKSMSTYYFNGNGVTVSRIQIDNSR